ncbi:MAG: adenosylcobinamide-GDP ribazoletransferase [Candidatus Paceibacterota bacterium]
MTRMMQHIYTAFDFLTVTDFREGKHGGDIYPVFFPVVGLVTGLIFCLVFSVFYLFFPIDIAVIFSIFAYAIFTGAKHLDDFADYIDAFLGGRNISDRQRILDDPDAGTFAIVAIIFLLMLYFKIFSLFSSDVIFSALLLMPVISRWSVLFPVYEEVRKEKRMNKFSKYDFYIATVIVAGISSWVLGWHALVLMVVAFMLASVIFHKSEKIFEDGFYDILGFTIESNSILFLLGIYILSALF